MKSAFERFSNVVEMHRYRRIVADSPGRSKKNHRRGNFFREDHGIMPSAARHSMGLATGFLNGMFDLLYEKRIHRHRILRQKRPPLHGHTAPRAGRFGLSNQFV